jgi:hypothetical protein
VSSSILKNSSRLWAETIDRQAITGYSALLGGNRLLLKLADDDPDAFEMLANKLHHGTCTLREGVEPNTTSWMLLAQLADKYECVGSIWFEADFWLRSMLRIWTLSHDTHKLWDGMVIAYWVGNDEWFGSYSKRLSLIHFGSFATLGIRMKDQILGLKLARTHLPP